MVPEHSRQSQLTRVFTGIIEDLGRVISLEQLARGKRLRIETSIPSDDFVVGESITVNGACMTVVSVDGPTFSVEVSAESLRCTTLGDLVPDDRVNLERSIRLSDRLGGHLVSGHVDGTGKVASIRQEGESSIYRFSVPCDLTRLMVEKGSIAVDGISLTCFACSDDGFDVAVIPHTAAVTTLGLKKPGMRVNIETDLLAKYVAKLAQAHMRASSADSTSR